MLDNLSSGRLGFGRGASPVELAFFGVPDRDIARDMYLEGLSADDRPISSRATSCPHCGRRFHDPAKPRGLISCGFSPAFSSTGSPMA